MSRHFVRLAIASLIAATACKKDQPLDDQQQHIQDVVKAGGVVDSILPIAVHLERFRKGLGASPDSLVNASSSVRELAERWTNAVANADTAALNLMVMNRAEFAWFYYPDSRMSKPPYEAPPELFWGQLLASSDEGARAALKAFGTQKILLKDVRCPAVPIAEGANLLHEGCTVTLVVNGKAQPDAVYFGTILERDKRFKFIGLSNKL